MKFCLILIALLLLLILPNLHIIRKIRENDTYVDFHVTPFLIGMVIAAVYCLFLLIKKSTSS